MHRLLPLSAILMPALLVAEPPDTIWTRTLGTAGDDYGRAVIVDAESCYVAAGTIAGSPYSACYLCRVRPDGTPDYGQSCGGRRAYGLCATPGGGYVLVGSYITTWPDTSEDVYLAARDARGNARWSRVWAYQGSEWIDFGTTVAPTADGGYIVAAHSIVTGGHIWLLRTGPTGDTLWSQVHTVQWYWTIPWWVCQVDDGGFALVGQTSSGTESDFFLLRTDSLGNALWSRSYGGDDEERAYGGCRALDGGYCLAGYTQPSGGTYGVYVVRTDSLGDTLWTRVFDSPVHEVAYSVCATSDSGFLVAGKCGSYDASDMYFVRLDAAGDTLWTKRVGGPLAEVAYSVAETPDRAYIAVGSTASFGAGETDLWMVKLAWEAGVTGSTDPTLTPLTSPTVVRGILNLTRACCLLPSDIVLLDASGRKVLDLAPGPNDISWLAPGVYFVRTAGPARRVVVTR